MQSTNYIQHTLSNQKKHKTFPTLQPAAAQQVFLVSPACAYAMKVHKKNKLCRSLTRGDGERGEIVLGPLTTRPGEDGALLGTEPIRAISDCGYSKRSSLRRQMCLTKVPPHLPYLPTLTLAISRPGEGEEGGKIIVDDWPPPIVKKKFPQTHEKNKIMTTPLLHRRSLGDSSQTRTVRLRE